MIARLVTVLALLAAACVSLRAQGAGTPTIASLSSSQTITEGLDLTLSVSVNGTTPFTYQWRKGGTAISGATNNAYAFAPIRVADAGTYTVVVTNSVGSVTSGPVVLAVNAAVAPTFYSQPSATSVYVGDSIYLYASVSGTSPLSFVWKQGATTVATTTNSTYTKSGATAGDAGSYTVTVSNIAGSVTSNAFTLTVNPLVAPVISGGPNNVTVVAGDSFYFYPSVSGPGAITYQWKKDGVAIAGANSAYFNKYNTMAADAGDYTLTATNSAGSTTSAAGRVTVTSVVAVAPTISSVSGAVSVVTGDSFSLSVYASGTSSLSYQWRKDGTAIAGATNSYYSKSNAQAADAGAYTVVVSNSQGSVTSTAMTVAITSARPPVITYHPPSFAVRLGDYLYSISLGVGGTGPFSYQWRKNGVALSGATDSSYYFYRNSTGADAGAYTVVVTNTQGSVTSEPCNLTVLPAAAPTITQQPISQAVVQGVSFALYANVAGSPTLAVQWRKEGVNIAGATGTSYGRNAAASSDAGAYSYVVSNSAGTATSANANLTVLAASLPKITQHPASASLLPGDYFYGMYVAYSAGQSATVQWYRDGVAIAGATSGSYYISNAQPSIAGTYTAVVTNSAGTATSREGVITVDSNVARPTFTYVPGGRAVAGGSGVSLEVTTSGSGETVQWFKDGLVIPNVSTKSYSFSNFTTASPGTYTVQVINSAGTFTSRSIVLELLDSGTAPVITIQPVSVAATAGSYTQFSVTAQGETPLSYQWRKDGVALTGATSSYFYLSPITSSSGGAYTAVVTNRNGSATSSAAALTLTTTTQVLPTIMRHPASQTVSSTYGSASLDVSLLSTEGVSYQWSKNGTAIAGATSSYYYPSSASLAGRYAVTVTNAAGSVTSYDAVIALTSTATGPVFSVQPADKESYPGGTVTFTASATGAAPVSYQWRKNGANLAGATTDSLTLSNIQGSDAATYGVLATDANGSTPSAAASLTVLSGIAPYIISQTTSIVAPLGASATFNTTVGGTPTPTVQWRKNGVDIPGATNLQFTLASVQSGDAATYTLVARSAAGTATTSGALLTIIYPPPAITTQPSAANVLSGGSVTFAVGVSSGVPPAYQWRKDGLPLAGATSSSLTLNNVQSAAAGRYSVVVSTSFGSATSIEALLTVGNPVSVAVPAAVSAIAGNPVSIVATVSAIDPLVYRWARNGSFIPGASQTALTLPAVQPSDAGPYVLVVSRPDGTVLYPLTGSGALVSVLTVLPRPAPSIQQQPVGATLAYGADATLTVRAQGSGGTLAYQWFRNGQPIAGSNTSTLRLPAVRFEDAGDYTVVIADLNGSIASVVARIVVNGSPYVGTYFGSLGPGDPWALQVGADGKAVFLALLAARGQAIVQRDIVVQAGGAFRFGQPRPTAAADASPYASRFYDGEVQGLIASNGVIGQLVGASLELTGQRVVPSSAPLATGFYQAVPLASELGEVAAITGPDGSVLLVAVDSTGVRGGRGTVDGSGAFTVSQSQYSYRGTLSSAGGGLQGTYAPAGNPPVQLAALRAPVASDRLANVATRGLAGSGARILTAGFVIAGTGTKEMLVRAVGPALTGFGLTGVLANPRLRLFRGDIALIENDDWALGGFATQIADAASRVGAFALPPAGADAAVLVRLDPGAYTAQILSDAPAAGVALIEVYDTTAATASAARLVNLSTRGEVGRGGDVLIVGIIVGGAAPRRFLIRGIGPALTAFGVAGVLENPRLQLFQGATLLRENDNWSDSNDATALAATATSVGAFALPAGGKDAALLLYLAPGSYTAQVSGVGDTTGVALVEVYDVP